MGGRCDLNGRGEAPRRLLEREHVQASAARSAQVLQSAQVVGIRQGQRVMIGELIEMLIDALLVQVLDRFGHETVTRSAYSDRDTRIQDVVDECVHEAEPGGSRQRLDEPCPDGFVQEISDPA